MDLGSPQGRLPTAHASMKHKEQLLRFLDSCIAATSSLALSTPCANNLQHGKNDSEQKSDYFELGVKNGRSLPLMELENGQQIRMHG